MENINEFETPAVSQDFISRLGYRETCQPQQFNCIRNGEPLRLIVHFFQNKNTDKVIYYTEAIYIPNGQLRHSALFQFQDSKDHEKLHKFCLHTLFFDERIEELFEAENKFHPSSWANNPKAESWLNWIRVYWNTKHFENTYKELGGINSNTQLIRN